MMTYDDVTTSLAHDIRNYVDVTVHELIGCGLLKYVIPPEPSTSKTAISSAVSVSSVKYPGNGYTNSTVLRQMPWTPDSIPFSDSDLEDSDLEGSVLGVAVYQSGLPTSLSAFLV